MEIKTYLKDMQNIQNLLLRFIDTNDVSEIKLKFLFYFFDKLNGEDKRYKLKEFLNLIAIISFYHNRKVDLINKIEKILFHLKKDIIQIFPKDEIFSIFYQNKRILFFLIKEDFIQVDHYIFKKLSVEKYRKYFLNEITSFLKGQKINFDQNFDDKRKIGENHNYICELIRQDLIVDFISHVNRTNISLSSRIKESIFETNEFLIGKNPTLIEYAAFHGSIQIFQYLYNNNVEAEPTLWLYAIHSNNSELIQFLIDNKIEPEDKTYEECFIESIKCHHNEIASYIKENYIESNNRFFSDITRYHNYYFFTDNFKNHALNIIRYDYPLLVKLLFNSKIVDFESQFQIKQKIPLQDNTNFVEDFKNKYKFTALHAVVAHENIEIINFLLSNTKIDVNNKTLACECKYPLDSRMKTSTEETALDIAIKKENIDIVKLLLSYPSIDINLKSSFHYLYKHYFEYEHTVNENIIERTPLHVATEKGNIEIIKLLLSRPEIDVNEKLLQIYRNWTEKKDEKTALILAVENKDIDVIKLLLSHPKIDVNIHFLHHEVSYDPYKPYKGYTLYLRYEKPIQCGIEYNKYDKSALFMAVENGNIEIIKLFLFNPDIDINKKFIFTSYDVDEKRRCISTRNEKSILHIAVEKGNVEIIAILLSRSDIDINSRFLNAKFAEDKEEDKDKEDKEEEDKEEKEEEEYKENKKLKYVYTKFENEEKTAIHIALENENIEIIKLLLSNSNIDINSNLYSFVMKAEDDKFHPYNWTINEKPVLNIALEKNNIEIFKLLLSNVNIAINNESYLRSFILSNYKSKQISKIQRALKNGIVEIIRHFHNIKNEKFFENISEKKTVLCAAVENRNVEIVKLILSNPNIDTNIKFCKYENGENDTKTSLCLAVEKGYNEIVKLLLLNPKTDVNIKSFHLFSHKNQYFFDIYKKTPLYIAIENGNVEIVQQLLLNPNIDINIKTKFKVDGSSEEDKIKSPMDIALEKGNIDIILALMDKDKEELVS